MTSPTTQPRGSGLGSRGVGLRGRRPKHAPRNWPVLDARVIANECSPAHIMFLLEDAQSDIARLTEACRAAQGALAMMTEPDAIKSTSVQHAWAQAVAAEADCRAALAAVHPPEAP